MSDTLYPSAGGSYVRLPSGELKKVEDAALQTPVATDTPVQSDDSAGQADPKAKAKASA